jgi:hypothetical protein
VSGFRQLFPHIGIGRMVWIHLAKDIGQWWVGPKMVLNFQVPKTVRKSSICWTTVGFSRVGLCSTELITSALNLENVCRSWSLSHGNVLILYLLGMQQNGRRLAWSVAQLNVPSTDEDVEFPVCFCVPKQCDTGATSPPPPNLRLHPGPVMIDIWATKI